jgi:hypothetical protein
MGSMLRFSTLIACCFLGITGLDSVQAQSLSPNVALWQDGRRVAGPSPLDRKAARVDCKKAEIAVAFSAKLPAGNGQIGSLGDVFITQADRQSQLDSRRFPSEIRVQALIIPEQGRQHERDFVGALSYRPETRSYGGILREQRAKKDGQSFLVIEDVKFRLRQCGSPPLSIVVSPDDGKATFNDSPSVRRSTHGTPEIAALTWFQQGGEGQEGVGTGSNERQCQVVGLEPKKWEEDGTCPTGRVNEQNCTNRTIKYSACARCSGTSCPKRESGNLHCLEPRIGAKKSCVWQKIPTKNANGLGYCHIPDQPLPPTPGRFCRPKDRDEEVAQPGPCENRPVECSKICSCSGHEEWACSGEPWCNDQITYCKGCQEQQEKCRKALVADTLCTHYGRKSKDDIISMLDQGIKECTSCTASFSGVGDLQKEVK